MTPVEQIKAKLDIVDYIGEVVKLRKSGKSYAGFCPFHANTKTPSFYVFPETQTWHCFGACGTGGDIFSFVMKRENADFAEALRTLAARAGVELKARTPVDAEEDARIRRLRDVLESAARYFHNLLINSPAAQSVRDYLARRDITSASIVAFQLGFAPDSWDALGKYLAGKGFQPQDVLDAGLASPREGGGQYDRFRNRLMFPIRDIKGQTIGFGARALADDQQPKYLNSPQTPLFEKSAVLYGIDLAKDAIRASNAAVIVEGYVDALMAHQQGHKNVVAAMGTALTELQLKTLQRLAKKFILALDADAAGFEAMRRGLSVAQDALDKEAVPVPVARDLIAFEGRLQSEIRVAVLPSGYDPDDLLREDPAAWQTMLDASLPVVDYLIQIVTAPLDLSSAKGKSEAANTLLPLIRTMADGVQRAHYVQDLARRLRIDERTLLDLARSAEPATRGARARPAAAVPASKAVERLGLEDFCLAMLLRHPDELAAIEPLGLMADDFMQSENRQIFEALRVLEPDEGAGPAGDLRQRLNDALHSRYDALVEHGLRYEPLAVEELEKPVLRLREQRLRQMIERLRFLEIEAQSAGDAAELQEYRQRILLAAEQLDWTQSALRARTMLGRAESAANEKAV